MTTDVESYRQSVYAAIEAAGPEVFPEFFEPIEPAVANTETGRVERPEPPAPARAPENVTYTRSEGVTERFSQFLAEQRAIQNGGADDPNRRANGYR